VASEQLMRCGAAVMAAAAAGQAWQAAVERNDGSTDVAAFQHRAEDAGRQLEWAQEIVPSVGANTAAMPTLSAREREIAALVAEGLSNRAVAERLVIGVRTVESHMLRIYRKLGIDRREDVAAALARHPR
jgi:DNA-binding CsgD family transcriptional regulator